MIKPDKDTTTTKLTTTIPIFSRRLTTGLCHLSSFWKLTDFLKIAPNLMKGGLNHNNVNRDQKGRN